jgi:hypothetical protein
MFKQNSANGCDAEVLRVVNSSKKVHGMQSQLTVSQKGQKAHGSSGFSAGSSALLGRLRRKS